MRGFYLCLGELMMALWRKSYFSCLECQVAREEKPHRKQNQAKHFARGDRDERWIHKNFLPKGDFTVNVMESRFFKKNIYL